MLLFPHKLLQSVLVKICDNIPIRARALERNRNVLVQKKEAPMQNTNVTIFNLIVENQKQMNFVGLGQELPFHTDLRPVLFYFVIGFIKI